MILRIFIQKTDSLLQIVQIDSISKIHTYFNNRLKLDLQPVYSSDVIVSRERVKGFKAWVGG